MNKLCLISAMIIFPTIALGEDYYVHLPAQTSFIRIAPSADYLMTAVDPGTHKEVFSMKPGACIRGPLSIKSPDETVVFTLGDGVDYPTGCSAKK